MTTWLKDDREDPDVCPHCGKTLEFEVDGETWEDVVMTHAERCPKGCYEYAYPIDGGDDF